MFCHCQLFPVSCSFLSQFHLPTCKHITWCQWILLPHKKLYSNYQWILIFQSQNLDLHGDNDFLYTGLPPKLIMKAFKFRLLLLSAVWVPKPSRYRALSTYVKGSILLKSHLTTSCICLVDIIHKKAVFHQHRSIYFHFV